MKILAVQETDWLMRGPHPQHHFLERLAQRGHDVRVIHYPLNWRQTHDVNSRESQTVIHGVHRATTGPGVTLITPRFIKLPGLELLSMATVHATTIWNELRKFPPDLVIGFSIVNSFVAMLLARRAGIPFVYQTIDVLPALVPWKGLRGLSKLLVGALYRSADRVLVISDALKEFAENLGADSSKCFVIPAGVDTEMFATTGYEPELRTRLGLDGSEVVIGYLGYVYAASGLVELLPKIREAKAQGARIALLVIGHGEGIEELVSRARSLGLSDSVIVTGWLSYENVPTFLKICDIFVFPGMDSELLRHIVPMKFYEYLAAGKPVVSTSLEGIAREFQSLASVHLVSSAIQIVDTALSVVANPDQCRIEGERGESFVKDQRSWFRLTDQIERCLLNLISSSTLAKNGLSTQFGAPPQI